MKTTVVPELLTPSEAAIECRVSAQTIRQWVRNGDLEARVMPSGRLRIPLDALASLQRTPSHARPGELKRAKRGPR